MTEVVDFYSRGIKRKMKNYWAAWPSWTRYNLGDVGVLNGHVFEKEATLAEIGIAYSVQEGADASPLDISSESGVTLEFKLAGQTNSAFTSIVEAEAGVKVEFGQTGAFIIEAPEIFESEVTERLALQKDIIRAYRDGRWEKEWLVITRLVRAPSATVLISRSSDAALEVAATANLSAVVTALGDANAGITVRKQHGDTLNMLCGENVTPLFQLSRLKTSFFAPPKFSIKSMGPIDPSLNDLTPARIDEDAALRDSIVFETMTDDEILES
jgi:hypothetical protein